MTSHSFRACLSAAWVLIPIWVVLCSAGGVASGTIDVTVDGIRARDGGDLVVALFNRESGWLDQDSTFARIVVPVLADTARVVFENVPYGTSYAVQVIHDRNICNTASGRPYPIDVLKGSFCIDFESLTGLRVG